MDEITVRPQRWSRRHVAAIVGVGFLVMGGLTVAGLQSANPRRPVALADGTTATLEGITFGTEQRVTGSLWQQLLHTVLPGRLKELSRTRVLQGGTPGTLGIWYTHPLPPTMFSDYVGIPFDDRGNTGPSTFSQGLGNNLERFEFSSWPRRSSQVGVRIYRRHWLPEGGAKWTLLGELRGANPARGSSFPEWTAPALPVSSSSGELGYTLLRFGPVEAPSNMELNPAPGEVYWRADYQVTESGKPTHNWSASMATLSDATGNRLNPASRGYVGDHRQLQEYFTAPPMPDEKAFRLKVRLIRTSSARFAPDELWTLSDLPIPGKKQAVLLGRKSVVRGMPLELVGIYGPGATIPGRDGPIPAGEKPSVLLKRGAAGMQDHSSGFIRMSDDRGRPCSPHGGSSSTGSDNMSWEVHPINVEPGAKRLNLVYAVHKIREVELLVPRSGT